MSAQSVSRRVVDEIVADASDGDGEDKEAKREKGTRESENQNFVSARDSESAQTGSVQTKDTQASSRNNPSFKKQTVDREMQTVDIESAPQETFGSKLQKYMWDNKYMLGGLAVAVPTVMALVLEGSGETARRGKAAPSISAKIQRRAR